MKDYPCPTCGKGRMRPVTIKRCETVLGGKPAIIDEAHFDQCSQCDERTVHAKELKRWRKQIAQQADS